MTARELVTAALAELNVADATTALSADDATFALARLNDFLDGLATENLTIFAATRTTWTLTPNVATYTIGVGATINVARPVSPQAILDIGYQDTSLSPVQEISGLPVLTTDQYAGLPLKTMTGTYPTSFYYSPTFGATGFGTISVFPVPTGSNLQGVIYTPSPVAELTDLNTTLSVPPGYRRFLRLNLALELASAFQAQVPPTLVELAREAKANVKRVNARFEDLSGWGGGHYSIFSDSYYPR